MTVTASASVPPSHRLIDADTINLNAIRRPGDLFPVVNGSYPAPKTDSATCPPWCPGNCYAEEDGARLHERFVATTTATEHGFSGEAMRNAVEVESYDAADVRESASVSLTTVPAVVKPADKSVVDGLDPVMIRSLAASALSGYQGGRLRLTPDEAEQLGRALIEGAALARQAHR